MSGGVLGRHLSLEGLFWVVLVPMEARKEHLIPETVITSSCKLSSVGVGK